MIILKSIFCTNIQTESLETTSSKVTASRYVMKYMMKLVHLHENYF